MAFFPTAGSLPGGPPLPSNTAINNNIFGYSPFFPQGPPQQPPSAQPPATPSGGGSSGGASGGGQSAADYGFPTPGQVNPGERIPGVWSDIPRDYPNLHAPIPAPGQDYINSFMPPVFTAPFYNAAGVAGNLGTMMGAGVAPNAAGFMNELFNPNLNQMEQAFMGAGLGNASRALEQGMMRQEAQFEGTPYHSGLARAQGDVMEQVGRDLISQGAGLGLQRQQMAAQRVMDPFNFTLNTALTGPALSQQMFNMYNNAFAQGTQLPMQVYTQIPVPAPVVSSGGGGKI